jgi:hypothetical protein
MSILFNALKRAQFVRPKLRSAGVSRTIPVTLPESRKAVRIYIQIPLFVYGYTLRGDPFCEEVHTISINSDGGVLALESAVRPGQSILVTNKGNEQAQACEVVSVVARLGNSFDVEFKFPLPMPQFWRNVEIGKTPALVG